MGQVGKIQRLGLKDALQRWEINDSELAQQTARDGIVEHFVVKDADFACEDGFARGAAGQSVEHVEEDEAGEGHGRVSGCYHVVVGHFEVVSIEGAEHNDGGGLEHALD